MSGSTSAAPEAVLRRLEWTVMRRLDGVLHGDYRTLFRGQGLDLADLREYVYHDDVRHIDWNVTARLQTPYVREYNEEREVAAWFLLDLSASVDFGSKALRKRAVATEFVTVLARILTRHGNRVGALFYASRRGARSFSSFRISSACRDGPSRSHAWPNATTWSPSACTTRWRWNCPTWACW